MTRNAEACSPKPDRRLRRRVYAPGELFHVRVVDPGAPAPARLTLEPAIPYGAMEGEDETIQRVSFARTPGGALAALEAWNIGGPFEVHIYANESAIEVRIPPTTLVPDVESTGEVWCRCPVAVRLVAKLRSAFCRDMMKGVTREWDGMNQSVAGDSWLLSYDEWPVGPDEAKPYLARFMDTEESALDPRPRLPASRSCAGGIMNFLLKTLRGRKRDALTSNVLAKARAVVRGEQFRRPRVTGEILRCNPDWGFGGCYALAAAILRIVPMGEPLALFVGGEPVHAVVRLPHTQDFVDAWGIEPLDVKALRFEIHGPGEWRSLREDELETLVAGGSRERLRRLVRSATPAARRLLMRRNADEDLRDLERAAQLGDLGAVERLVQAKLRIGQAAGITLGELSHLSDATLRRVAGVMPVANLRRLAGVAPEVLRPPLPAMTHEEIVRTLRAHNAGWMREWEDAIEEEAAARAAYHASPGRRRRPASAYTDEARTISAQWVSEFLGTPRSLEPVDVFSHRPIHAKAWATAERLREILSPTTAAAAREVAPVPRRLAISDGLRRLIRAEIGNEEHGGASPATLESALDSVRQGYDPGHGDDMNAVQEELEELIRRHGGGVELESIQRSSEADPHTLADLSVLDWPEGERRVMLGALRLLEGGPVATPENLPFFTLVAARDALATAITRGLLNASGLLLATRIVARLPEGLTTCSCAHSLSIHGPGQPACHGTGADLDPQYQIPPDEPCACEAFEAEGA